jgi:hypothetical protein
MCCPGSRNTQHLDLIGEFTLSSAAASEPTRQVHKPKDPEYNIA